MKLFPRNAILAALTFSAFGTSSFADLGPDLAGRIPQSGGGFEKGRAPGPTWLGVRIADAPVEISGRLPIEPGTGILVDEVMAGSPAAIAGFLRGDVLIRLNHQTLVTVTQFQSLVKHRKAGEQVEITFFRKGEKRKVVVVLQSQERMR